MRNLGPFLIRNVLKFSGQDWGKTKAKLEVSWLPSSCMNAVWGKSVFLTHGAMSSTECRRAEEGLPTHAGRSDAPRPRPRTTDHCSRVLGPAVTVTCRNHSGAARTHATSQGGIYVSVQIPTSVLLIKPVVSNITGRTFVLPSGPI